MTTECCGSITIYINTPTKLLRHETKTLDKKGQVKMFFLVEALHTSTEMPYFCDMILLHYELFHQHLTQKLK